MKETRWCQVEEVFHQVLAVRGEERGRLLDEACAGDTDLYCEVSSLLAMPDAGPSIWQAVAAEADSLVNDVRTAAVGRRLGPYRLQALLGEGGMGAVYLAERDDAQFDKRVAIKILPHVLSSPQAIARFRDERQILATLEHGNIVRLLDGGSTDDGLPYLVMEHVEGSSITAFASKRTLSVRARVLLVRDVCAALQYAHQNLVIHRDVKPNNILVDETGTPKLVDFGIAKLLVSTSSSEREARTRTGCALFTPEYASPEQARGEVVSTATDVYSVGAVLYELVAERPPHEMAGDILENVRTICDVAPVRPSLAAPLERRREVSGDLDNIILKSLHKDHSQRYRTIEQFSDDLERFLSGQPVKARIATLSYRARKFVGRNKAAVLATMLVVIALTASTVISYRQAVRADAQARRAEDAAASALVEKKRAEAETARTQAETKRARKAEQLVQNQLEQITVEESKRKRAEERESLRHKQVELTREQLQVALSKAHEETRIAEQESAKAREAETRAEHAARAEKRLRVEVETLLQQEQERVKDLEGRVGKIVKELL